MRKKKTKIFLMGGLGNNLFQLSFAENLKQDGHEIQYNTFLLNENVITQKIGWSIFPTGDLKLLLKGESVEETCSIIDLIYLIIIFFFNSVGIVDISSPSLKKIFFGRAIGYWQRGIDVNRNFLKTVKNTMLKNNGINTKVLETHNNVIHLRLGDFKTEDQLTMNYYAEAIALIGETKYTVVTNDRSVITKLRTVISGKDFILAKGKSVADDFYIMASANKLIMSNSTFCYWASQVGMVNDVVFPDKLSKKKQWTFPLLNSRTQKAHSGI